MNFGWYSPHPDPAADGALTPSPASHMRARLHAPPVLAACRGAGSRGYIAGAAVRARGRRASGLPGSSARDGGIRVPERRRQLLAGGQHREPRRDVRDDERRAAGECGDGRCARRSELLGVGGLSQAGRFRGAPGLYLLGDARSASTCPLRCRHRACPPRASARSLRSNRQRSPWCDSPFSAHAARVLATERDALRPFLRARQNGQATQWANCFSVEALRPSACPAFTWWAADGVLNAAAAQHGWLGDPPHEPQGWYSIYDTDATTLAVVANASAALRQLLTCARAAVGTSLLAGREPDLAGLLASTSGAVRIRPAASDERPASSHARASRRRRARASRRCS